jgi:hypothetical protein
MANFALPQTETLAPAIEILPALWYTGAEKEG